MVTRRCRSPVEPVRGMPRFATVAPLASPNPAIGGRLVSTHAGGADDSAGSCGGVVSPGIPGRRGAPEPGLGGSRGSGGTEDLRLVLGAAGVGTWRWERATGRLEWDAALHRIFGLAPGSFPGRLEDWLDLVHPDDRARCREVVGAAVREGHGYRLEYRAVPPGGAVRWVSGSGGVLADPTGAVIGATGCTADITERVATEQALQASLARERWLRERLEFLAGINLVLNECDTRSQIVRRVTRAVVPRLGDWCAICLVDESTASPTFEVAHVDPAMVAFVAELRARFPYDSQAPGGMAAVVRTGEPEMVVDIDDGLLDRIDVDPEVVRVVRQLGLRSSIIVPLAKRGRVLGAMQFVSTGDRLYDSDDLALARALAGRVASALENRRHGDEQRLIAQTLQRSLLPEELPEVAIADLAVRYWAAGEGVVGGDFYDVFELDSGATALAMGDVCGHGPRAAAVTSLARYTIRATAWNGDDPVSVLEHLNRAMLRTRPDTFCTVVYAVATPVDAGMQVVVASGGHPLPVVVRRDGTTEPLGHPGMIVGLLEDVAYRPASTVLVPGDTVVFYTDGATDLPPPGDLDPDQLADLVARAVAVTSTVEEAASVIADRLLRRVPLPEWKDDVALLLLRVTGTARTERPVA